MAMTVIRSGQLHFEEHSALAWGQSCTLLVPSTSGMSKSKPLWLSASGEDDSPCSGLLTNSSAILQNEMCQDAACSILANQHTCATLCLIAHLLTHPCLLSTMNAMKHQAHQCRGAISTHLEQYSTGAPPPGLVTMCVQSPPGLTLLTRACKA